MSTLVAANIRGTTASGNIITIPAGHTLRSANTGGIVIPGSVIQAFTTTLATTFSAAVGTTPTAVTNLSVNITPRYNTSKILVFGQVYGNGTLNVTQLYLYMYRNGAVLTTGMPTSGTQMANSIARNYWASADVMVPVPFSLIDNPATTSLLTYQVYVSAETSSTVYINRTQNDAANSGGTRAISVITAMEIAV